MNTAYRSYKSFKSEISYSKDQYDKTNNCNDTINKYVNEALNTFTNEQICFKTEKIFIGNIPSSASKYNLIKYFSSYGKIVDCVVMIRQNGVGRGFGFCEFLDSSSVDTIMSLWPQHKLNGQWVEVKLASPENLLRKLRTHNR